MAVNGAQKSSYVVKIHCEVNSTHSFYYANFIAHLHFYYDNIYVWMKMKGDARVHEGTKGIVANAKNGRLK